MPKRVEKKNGTNLVGNIFLGISIGLLGSTGLVALIAALVVNGTVPAASAESILPVAVLLATALGALICVKMSGTQILLTGLLGSCGVYLVRTLLCCFGESGSVFDLFSIKVLCACLAGGVLGILCAAGKGKKRR